MTRYVLTVLMIALAAPAAAQTRPEVDAERIFMYPGERALGFLAQDVQQIIPEPSASSHGGKVGSRSTTRPSSPCSSTR